MVFGPKGHDTLKLDYATAGVPRPVVRPPSRGVSSYVSCPTVLSDKPFGPSGPEIT